MGVKWKTLRHRGKTYSNIRYYEVDGATHGALPDRRYFIRHRVFDASKRKVVRIDEPIGLASEQEPAVTKDGQPLVDRHGQPKLVQRWTPTKLAALLATLEENKRIGRGPVTLAEMRALAEAERVAAEEQAALEAAKNVTVDEFFRTGYTNDLSVKRKAKSTVRGEELLYLRWVSPVIGKMPLRSVRSMHVQAVETKLREAGKSVRTQMYARQIIHRVFELAIDAGAAIGKNPAKRTRRIGTKEERLDNARLGWLTRDEAVNLLTELKHRARAACIASYGHDRLMETSNAPWDLHDSALLSLATGMRAGEIFNLQWGRVDLTHRKLTVDETKSGKDRILNIESIEFFEMLQRRRSRADDTSGSALVFPGRRRNTIKVNVSKAFRAAVKALMARPVEDGGIEPRAKKRDAVCFHTLRHSYATWFMQDGGDIYDLKYRLGHRDVTTTQRYAKHAPPEAGEMTSMFATGKPGRPLRAVK